MRPLGLVLLVLAGVLLAAGEAAAQTNLQLWGDVSLNWLKGDRKAISLDLEPQKMVAATADVPSWGSFSVTPNFEYSARNWMDLITEVGTGFTSQTDGLTSFELTPRAGVRFHVFSRDMKNVIDQFLTSLLTPEAVTGERPPRRRLVVRDRFLVEGRNIFYNKDQPTSSTVRLRNRVEFLFPLNRPKVTDRGARVWLADWEWFMPIGVDASERFSNRQRIRTGIVWRQSFAWRAEVIYVWTRSRNTIDQPFSTSDNAISVTIRRFYK